ncbi:N-acetylglucosamine-6-phosphate deacetylase [Yoonia sp. SS1-5]|uniref:N-acetylglucosamine-6-phosphate deacetylase n=1 Tax=Yoonia rhodophyticola TaxID=3137370 RepID=A0AAN0M9P1_9RHOB
MLIGVAKLWQQGLLHDQMGIVAQNGTIMEIRPLDHDTPDHIVPLALPYLTDLQVNGGGGVMINSDPTPDGFRTVAAAHRRQGTGTILPTVITDSPDVIARAADAAIRTKGEPGLAGLHIEGPHIAPDRRGTHDAAHIRPLDLATVTLVEDLRAKDLPVMITLAPELAAPDLFARLVACGAVVAGGHSAATSDETKAALGRGLSCFTHLYNAMPPMTSRMPGILGAALNSDAYAGIIVDGIHVDWDMVRVALRARPRAGLTFAVSDAMATVGGPDHFTLYGQRIAVRDGALVNAEGSLAGAHINLVQSLRNLVTHVGLTLDMAIPMVSDIPRKVMGLPANDIAIGTAVDDMLCLRDDFSMMDIT